MIYLKYGLMITNVFLSFVLLKLDSAIALVTMTAAFFIFLDMYFSADTDTGAATSSISKNETSESTANQSTTNENSTNESDKN